MINIAVLWKESQYKVEEGLRLPMSPVVKRLPRRVGHTQSSFSCISMALLTLFVDNWGTYHVILIDLYQTDCQ